MSRFEKNIYKFRTMLISASCTLSKYFQDYCPGKNNYSVAGIDYFRQAQRLATWNKTTTRG